MSVPTYDRATLAHEFLRMANESYRHHYTQRVYFARVARDHGLTHQQIADAYEITEAAVRSMLKREVATL